MVALVTVLPEIGLCFLNGKLQHSILDHMKKSRNNAFVGAVFSLSIMMGW